MTKSTPTLDDVGSLSAILAHYHKSLYVLVSGKKVILYIRALSDLERDDQENYALLASHNERKALKDHTSSSYLARIAPLQELDDGELNETIEVHSARRLWAKVWSEVPVASYVPPAASEPFTDDVLEQKERELLSPLDDEARERAALVKERSDLHKRFMSDLRNSLTTMSYEQKIAETKRLVIASRCDNIYERAMIYARVALSVYRDKECTQRAWTCDGAAHLPDGLVAQLNQEYAEVGDVPLSFLTERY